MMPSPMRHPLAVLRQILGMNQAQLGQLCGHSGRTIQAVELGKLALSEKLAYRIAEATGVSVGWLLNGDPTAPAKAECPSGVRSPNQAYTRDVYEAHRALLDVEVGASAGQGRMNTIEQLADIHTYGDEMAERDARLVALCEALLERTRGTGQAALIRWRIKTFLEKMDAQNPVSVPVQRTGRSNIASRRAGHA